MVHVHIVFDECIRYAHAELVAGVLDEAWDVLQFAIHRIYARGSEPAVFFDHFTHGHPVHVRRSHDIS